MDAPMITCDTYLKLQSIFHAAVMARTDAILTYGELSAEANWHAMLAELAYEAYHAAASLYLWRVPAPVPTPVASVPLLTAGSLPAVPAETPVSTWYTRMLEGVERQSQRANAQFNYGNLPQPPAKPQPSPEAKAAAKAYADALTAEARREWEAGLSWKQGEVAEVREAGK